MGDPIGRFTVTGGPLIGPWFHWVFLAAGLLMFGSGVRMLFAASSRARSWVRRSGVVVASRLDDGQFRVCVAFQEAGREVVFWNRFSSTGFGIDPIGRPVEVLMNPADPTDAVVVRGVAGGWLVGSTFMVAGLLFAVFGTAIAGRF